jgi:outer membrane biosynthesis protein TonB
LAPEDVSRIKSRSLGGRVAVIVNENGDVTDARVLTATPKEGGQILSDAVRTAKFAPRPGCGDLKIDFIFNLRE